MTLRLQWRAAWAVIAACALASPAPGREKAAKSAAEDMEPLRLQAFAIDRNAPGGVAAGPIEIVIERWSSDEERTRLRQALEKDSDELLRTLRDTKKVGYIRNAAGGLGWDVQYSRRLPLPEGGYRVVIATDRPMSFYERAANTRSSDYEFLIAELRVQDDGEGEGKLVPAARITFDKGANTIEIENYEREPVQLTKVVELDGDDGGKKKTTAPDGDDD